MNTTVTANGLEVTAKSNSIYLLITKEEANVNSAGAIQAENTGAGYTSVTTTTSSAVYPSALISNATVGGEVQAAVSSITNPTSWYTARALSPNASTVNSSSEVVLSSSNFTEYVLSYQYAVTLAKGSEIAANLKVASVAITPVSKGGASPTDNPITVLVVNHGDPTKFEEFTVRGKSLENGKYTITGSTVLAATLTDTTTVVLDVYIYYNGNDADVYTNNVANLNGATFEITFGVN